MIEPVRIGICSTYAPRACGLATFAADLESALAVCERVGDVSIVAMVNAEQVSDNPVAPVIAEISQGDARSYVAAARRANEACDVVLVQHEFGIFGGNEGSLILEFLSALTVPTVLTLHTVLSSFSPSQASVLRSAVGMVDAVTVFTPLARDLLIRQGVAGKAKIHVVPHGAPSVLFGTNATEARRRLDLADRFVVSTFGLLSPGKGLELAIESMRHIADAVPSAVLVIAGRTHPGESRPNGESYRSSLVAQVDRLGLGDHVRFIDSFLPIESIADVLAATDVFVTPYINSEQIVSGALTFAVASGCPVVSTDYLYARDLLASGAGTLVGSRDPGSFAEAVCRYATDDAFRASARAEASRIGEGMHWSAVGLQVADLVTGLLNAPKLVEQDPATGKLHLEPNLRSEPTLHVVRNDRQPLPLPLRLPLPDRRTGSRRPLAPLPAFVSGFSANERNEHQVSSAQSQSVPFTHLRRLVDGTGIVQHATGLVPLLSSGYCVDDVARLIPVAYRFHNDGYWDRVAARSVAFIANAVDPAGSGLAAGRGDLMHNFMAFDRSWLDLPSFGDHVGRAALGLASVVQDERYATVCEPILRSVFRDVPCGPAVHPVGYTLLAQSIAPWLTTRDRIAQLVNVLLGQLRANTTSSWLWFEESVRYDAAMLVEALLAGGVALDDEHVVETAFEVLRWLDDHCDAGDHVRFPGHLGMRKDQTIAGTGDEQPLEALALVRAHARAWEATGDRWFRDRAVLSHAWFNGRNRLGVAVVDDDGGCFDGLGSSGVNRNQGAESTLAFVSSALTIEKIHRSAPLSGLAREPGGRELPVTSPSAGQ